jgi:hypothetical protein
LKAKKLKNILSEYFEDTKLVETDNLLKASAAWKKAAGEGIVKNTEVFKINNGKLVIKTINPVWRNELVFQKNIFIQKLKKIDPQLKIKEIEFK